MHEIIPKVPTDSRENIGEAATLLNQILTLFSFFLNKCYYRSYTLCINTKRGGP